MFVMGLLGSRSMLSLKLLCCLFILAPQGSRTMAEDLDDHGHCHVKTYQYEKNAQARFGLLMSLRMDDTSLATNHKTCAQVLRAPLQNLLAVEWVLDRLNNANGGAGYINNVTLGFDGLDDCHDPTYSSRNGLSFADTWLPDSITTCSEDSHNTLHFGIVGPSHSSTAIRVASLFKDLLMPQISMGASAAELSNKSLFPTFLRTASSDVHQMTMIVDILEHLSWTYVVTIYEENEYGVSAARIFQEKARERNICIKRALPLPTQFLNELAKKIYDIQQDAKDYSLGVVFIGSRDKAEQFLWEIDQRGDSETKYGLHFIFTDAVNIDTTIFNHKEFGQGTLAIATSGLFLEDLYNDMRKKFERVQDGQESHSLIEEFINENPDTPLLDSDSLNSFIPLTVHAVMGLVHALKLEHDSACQGLPGLCDALIQNVHRGKLLTTLRNMSLDYSNMPAGVAPAAFIEHDITLAFDSNGDMLQVNEVPVYKVYQFMKTSTSNEYEEIGSFIDGVTTFNTNNVRMLNPHGTLRRKTPSSVCSDRCDDCLDNGQIPLAYMEGDAYILGIISMHDGDSNDPFGCGSFRSQGSDAIQAEAFLFAVRQLRQMTGINFGAVLMDDCYSPPRITSELSDFFSGLVAYDSNLFPFHFPRDKLVGVMACRSSGCAIPTASFFMPLKVPVVSYAASSPDLDDRVRFPYFLRTVPSDTYQARVMLEIVKEMGWEYVGLMYVNNNYGTKGMQAFKDLTILDGSGVCAAQEVSIDERHSEMDSTQFFQAWKVLFNQEVKVVVFFGIDSRFQAFLTYLETHSLYGKFIFLASEDWGNSLTIPQAGPRAARGSISLKVESMGLQHGASFRNYLLSKQPLSNDSNIWFREFWQNHFKCYFEGGLINDDSFGSDCNVGKWLSEQEVDEILQDQRVVHVMNAVIALGMGISDAKAKLCEGAFPCKFMQQYVDDEVLPSIKSQTRREGSLDVNVFDNQGNGAMGFDVYNVQQYNNQPFYVKIGTFSNKERLLQKDNIKFYTDTGNEMDHIDSKCTAFLCAHCPKTVVTAPQSNGGAKVENDCSFDDFRTSDILIISLVVVLILAVCVAVAVLVLCCSRKYNVLSKKLEHKEDQIYAEPETMVYQGDYLRTHGMTFANMDVDPYRLSSDGSNNDHLTDRLATLGRPPVHRGLSNPATLNDRVDSVSQVLQQDALSFRSQPDFRNRVVANSGPVSRVSAPATTQGGGGGRVQMMPVSYVSADHGVSHQGHENPAFISSPTDGTQRLPGVSLSSTGTSYPASSAASSIMKLPMTALTAARQGTSDVFYTSGDPSLHGLSPAQQQQAREMANPVGETDVMYCMQGPDGQLSPQYVLVPQPQLTSRPLQGDIGRSSVRSDASSSVNPDHGPYSMALARQKQAAKAPTPRANTPIYVLDPSAIELQDIQNSERSQQNEAPAMDQVLDPPTKYSNIQYPPHPTQNIHSQSPRDNDNGMHPSEQQPQYLQHHEMQQQPVQGDIAVVNKHTYPQEFPQTRGSSNSSSRRGSGVALTSHLNASIPDIVGQLSLQTDPGVLESVDLSSSRESLDDPQVVSVEPNGRAKFNALSALGGGSISRV